MSSAKEKLLQRFLGLLIFLLGSTVVLGWLLHVQKMVEFLPGSVPMVFNTGLCFAIAGLALCLPSFKKIPNETIQTAAGVVLIVLGTASFAEHFFDINLGIDMAWVHGWLHYGNVRPGRMAPNTSFGFITMGAALILLPRVTTRRRAIGLLTLTYLLLAIGLTGLAGYALGPDLLFGWAVSARMALHTASGMMVASAAIGFSWQQSGWYRSRSLLDEEQKIAFSGTAMLIVATITAGLTGFVTQQQTLQTALQQSLQTTARERAITYRVLINESLSNVRAEISGDGLIPAATRLLATTEDQAARNDFMRAARAVSGSTFTTILLLDPSRQPVAMLGEPTKNRTIAVPLAAALPTTFGWSAGRYTLQTEVPVNVAGQRVGTIVLEQLLRDFQQVVLGVEERNSSSEVVICASPRDQLDYYPSAKSPQPFLSHARICRAVCCQSRTVSPAKQGSSRVSIIAATMCLRRTPRWVTDLAWW